MALEQAEREVLLQAATCGRQEVEARLVKMTKYQGQRWRMRIIIVVLITLIYAAALMAVVVYI